MTASMRYHVPTRIYFGGGMISQVPDIIRQDLRAQRVFCITDSGVKAAGIAGMVTDLGLDTDVFSDIEPNPRHRTVDRAGAAAREWRPDVILGLGGGSVLDAAKAVALLSTNPGQIAEYEGREKYRQPPLPVVAIPTTCGTGSEVTWVAVITHTERRFKMSVKGPDMFPAVAVVDPDLLVSLPPHLVASTGMDAFVHAVEAFTVLPATAFTDLYAREAVRLIWPSLEAAYRDVSGEDEARARLMLGSTMAGMAFGNSDVGAVHCLSESVGALLDTPHGVANAVFLPYVMEFNLPAAAGRYAEIAGIMGIEDHDDIRAALSAIREIKSLSRRLQIPTFRELGISQDITAEIAENSFRNNSNPSNPRPVSAGDYRDILERAYRET